MRQILPHELWVGHDGDARDFTRIHEAGIKALVQLAFEEPALQTPRDLLYFRFPLVDGSGNQGDFLAMAIHLVSELLSRRVPTLVCCGAGMSRSPCIAAAALAIHLRVPFGSCLEIVTGQGPSDISRGLCAEVSEITEESRRIFGATSPHRGDDAGS